MTLSESHDTESSLTNIWDYNDIDLMRYRNILSHGQSYPNMIIIDIINYLWVILIMQQIKIF